MLYQASASLLLLMISQTGASLSSFSPDTQVEIKSLKGECPESSPCIRRPPVRGDIIPWHQDNVPYVLFPRLTMLLERTPILSWWDVAQAGEEVSYRVLLRDGNGDVIFERLNVAGTTLKVEQELLPGRYSFSVVANNSEISSSRERPVPGGIGFVVVNDEDRMAILSRQEEIRQSNLDPAEQQLAIGKFLIEERFFAEGVRYWKSLPKETQNSEIMLAIADVYWSNILNVHSAQKYYQKALDLAEADSLLAAEAMVGLALSKQVLSDLNSALKLLMKARAIYEARGRRNELKRVDRLINEVKELLAL